MPAQSFHSPGLTKISRAFSLIEILATVALIGVVASIVLFSIGNSSKAVMSTKLQSGAQKLNSIVAVYLSQGGSLDGLTTPQEVINKLKSVRPASEDQRNVGVMTGSGVDLRLAAQMQTSSEASGNNPHVYWDSTNKKFVYTTSPTPLFAGVSDFVLDDSLSTQAVQNDTRAQSNILFNGSNGWVWAAGNHSGPGNLGPSDQGINDVSNVWDPRGSTSSGSTTSGTTTSGTTTSGTTTSGTTTSGTTTSGTTTSGGGGVPTPPMTLPIPIISPGGGVYALALYPTQIYINPNGAPDGSSVLMYKLNNGPWMVYTGPFSVASGTKVTAYNMSTNPALYADSGTTAETYYFLVPSFSGTIAAKWNTSDGPNGLKSTIVNTNPDLVVETDGTAASGYGANIFTFARQASFAGVPPNQEFKVGQLNYTNGTINTGTGATGLHLHLDIAMTSPSVTSTPADIGIVLNNTVNSENAASSADIATLSNPVTNYSIVLNGVTYTLQIHYGSIDVTQGFVDNNNLSLHVYESASGSVPVVGSFVSSTP